MKIRLKHQKGIISPKKNNLHHIDDTWSEDLLDPNDYGSENSRGYRYVLVVIEIFVILVGQFF